MFMDINGDWLRTRNGKINNGPTIKDPQTTIGHVQEKSRRCIDSDGNEVYM